MQSSASDAGVGKRCAEKILSFSACIKGAEVAIFISALVFLICPGRADDKMPAQEKGEKSGVWVDVKLKDAEKLDEIVELRKKVARLEALEQSLRNENARLTAERNLLKQELFEAIKQMESQNAVLRRLELSVADLLATGKLSGASAREAILVEAIGTIIKSGQELALLSMEFCNEADAIVKSLPAGNLEGVRLRLKIDEVRSASRKFSTASRWSLNVKPVSRCRIMAVNTKLGFVVLPVGYLHGVFNGLTFYVPGKTTGAKPIVLRVFATRSNVAAAQVADGDIRTLSPGNEAVTDLQQTNK